MSRHAITVLSARFIKRAACLPDTAGGTERGHNINPTPNSNQTRLWTRIAGPLQMFPMSDVCSQYAIDLSNNGPSTATALPRAHS